MMKHRCGAPTMMSSTGKIILRSCRNKTPNPGYCWLHVGASGRGIGVRRAGQ